MNESNITSNDSDVTPDSSWTIVDDVQRLEALQLCNSLPIDEDFHVEEILTNVNDKYLDVTDSNSTIKDFLTTEKSQGDLKEDGFLTIDEYIEERCVEHDYEFDAKRIIFEDIIAKEEIDRKERKKNKAKNIATFSVIGTVMAVTALSLICMLIPKATDNSLTSNISKISDDAMTFPVQEKDYTCFADNRCDLVQFNYSNQDAGRETCPNQGLYPLTYESFTRTTSDSNNRVNATPENTMILNTYNTTSGGKDELLKQAVNKRKKSILKFLLKEQKRSKQQKKSKNSKSLHNTLAFYILHDLVILNVVYAMRKITSSTQLPILNKIEDQVVKPTKIESKSKENQSRTILIPKTKTGKGKSETSALKKSLQIIKSNNKTPETSSKILKKKSQVKNKDIKPLFIGKPQSSTSSSTEHLQKRTKDGSLVSKQPKNPCKATTRLDSCCRRENLSNVYRRSIKCDDLHDPCGDAERHRRSQTLIDKLCRENGTTNMTEVVNYLRLRNASSEIRKEPISLSPPKQHLFGKFENNNNDILNNNCPCIIRNPKDSENKFKLFVEKQRDKIKCARQSISQFNSAVSNTTKVIETCRNLVSRFSDSGLTDESTLTKSMTGIKETLSGIKKEMEIINQRLDSQKNGKTEEQWDKLHEEAAKYWEMKHKYLQMRSDLMCDLEISLKKSVSNYKENNEFEIPNRQIIINILENIIKDAVNKKVFELENSENKEEASAGKIVKSPFQSETVDKVQQDNETTESLPLLRFEPVNESCFIDPEEHQLSSTSRKCRMFDFYNMIGKRSHGIITKDKNSLAYARCRDSYRMRRRLE